MPNRNKVRVGYGTSTNVNPYFMDEQIEESIRMLEPETTPFLTLASKLSRKKPPKMHKIGIKLYDGFDHWDSATFLKSFEDIEDVGPRYAKLIVAQRSRPRDSQILYRPQETIYVQTTGQVLEIVKTSRGTHDVITQNPNSGFKTALTNEPTSGLEIIVRTINGSEVIPFDGASDFVWLDRQIYESADIDGETKRTEPYIDYNFVMHMETLFTVTEDTKSLVKMKGKIPQWSFDQEEQIRNFKKSVNYNLIFSQRGFIADPHRPTEPKRHMRGMMEWIQQNVAYYNPHSVEDFEKMIIKMINRSWFRYHKGKTKTLFCGRGFHEEFSLAFRDYRRSDTNKKSLVPGMKVESYQIGDFTIKLSVDDAFGRPGDRESYWAMIIDPTEMGLHVQKNFNARHWQPEGSRKFHHMVEWQGTITPGRTEYHALLRTV